MIPFDIEHATLILRQTPDVISRLTSDLSEPWLTGNEGEGTWSVTAVVGHLIQGEKEDWIPRTRIILRAGKEETFVPFDRDGYMKEIEGKTFDQLLAEFTALRAENIAILLSLGITEAQLDLEGMHPEFGPVTLRQMLSTWTAHDLAHIGQIVRVLAKQYKTEMGPWLKYMPRLK